MPCDGVSLTTVKTELLSAKPELYSVSALSPSSSGTLTSDMNVALVGEYSCCATGWWLLWACLRILYVCSPENAYTLGTNLSSNSFGSGAGTKIDGGSTLNLVTRSLRKPTLAKARLRRRCLSLPRHLATPWPLKCLAPRSALASRQMSWLRRVGNSGENIRLLYCVYR